MESFLLVFIRFSDWTGHSLGRCFVVKQRTACGSAQAGRTRSVVVGLGTDGFASLAYTRGFRRLLLRGESFFYVRMSVCLDGVWSPPKRIRGRGNEIQRMRAVRHYRRTFVDLVLEWPAVLQI